MLTLTKYIKSSKSFFTIFLTVHLSIFTSVFNQPDAQNLFHNKFYFMPLHVSSTCAHHQVCWPCCISVYLSQYLTNLMHKICFTISFISCLYMFRAHVLIIRRSKLHHTVSGIITPIGGPSRAQVERRATYRCDNTRDCVMQFWPPDDEHMCSKHVEAWNKT